MKNEEDLRRELIATRAELDMLYEIGNAMRTTLNLEQILYVILTAVTSGEGLGFNRAMLFLLNEKDNMLEGKMGLGPGTGEEAAYIWKDIEEQKMTLDDLVSAYDRFKSSPEQALNIKVKNVKIPLREEEGVLAMTALEDMAFEVTSEEARNMVVNQHIQKMLNLEYFATVPLKAKNRVLGVLLVDNIFTKKPITKSDIRFLQMFANHAGLAIENSRLYEETVRLTRIDWLTHLWNYGYFYKLLEESVASCLKNNQLLSILMIDLDNFKMYNDTFGHPKGDEALKSVSNILRDKTRKQDYVARYGGEEFAIIMPNTKRDHAFLIADRIRQATEAMFVDKEIKNSIHLTTSIGIASCPQDDTNPQNLIGKADQALYAAKNSGKNKVCLYDQRIQQ